MQISKHDVHVGYYNLIPGNEIVRDVVLVSTA